MKLQMITGSNGITATVPDLEPIVDMTYYYRFGHMFDDDFTTMWHSHFRFEDQLKVIGVEFYVSTIIFEIRKNTADYFQNPIYFYNLKIHKRLDACCTNRYYNVCLVLDGILKNCTGKMLL